MNVLRARATRYAPQGISGLGTRVSGDVLLRVARARGLVVVQGGWLFQRALRGESVADPTVLDALLADLEPVVIVEGEYDGGELPFDSYIALTAKGVARLLAIYPQASCCYERVPARWRSGRGSLKVYLHLGEPRYAPKGTDEVAEANSLTSDRVHGGDGTSFEVQHRSANPGAGQGADDDADSAFDKALEQAFANMRKRQPRGGRRRNPSGGAEVESASDSASGSAGETQVGSERPESVSPTAPEAAADDPINAPLDDRGSGSQGDRDVQDKNAENSGGIPAHPPQASGQPVADADFGQRGGDSPSVSPSEEDEAETEDVSAVEPPTLVGVTFSEIDRRLTAGSGSFSFPGRRSNVGFFRLPDGTHIDARLMAQVARALTEWVGGFGVGDQSPRWDYADLAVRVSALSGIQRARRAEIAPPSLLVLVDVSGSCLGFAPHALEVAQAIIASGTNIGAPMTLVTHTNGLPLEVRAPQGDFASADFVRVHHTSRDMIAGSEMLAGEVAWFIAAARKVEATHVVAIGDSDAQPAYEALARTMPLAWLDNHACNQLRPTRDRDWRARLGVRVIGCKDASDIAAALRIAGKEIRHD